MATIATFNVFFGLLMFTTHGVSIYLLPDWWIHRIVLFGFQQANGTWAELTLPVLIMATCVLATWILTRYTTTGRQLYAFGDNPEGARRLGINIAAMHFIPYLLARDDGRHWRPRASPLHTGGRSQCPDWARTRRAGRGRAWRRQARRRQGYGARLRARRASSISVTQNGLNLLGISPYAFKMVIGAIILVAISLSSDRLSHMLAGLRRTGDHG